MGIEYEPKPPIGSRINVDAWLALRDDFAKTALAQLLVYLTPLRTDTTHQIIQVIETVARLDILCGAAYKIADGMMRAREERLQPDVRTFADVPID